MLVQIPCHLDALVSTELKREQQLGLWLADQYGCKVPPALQALPGDAGQRRYFRVTVGGATRIAVDAPPATEDTHRFVARLQLLAGQGIRVPVLFAVAADEGFLLLEDLGDQLLWSQLRDPEAAQRLESVFALLRALRTVPADALPPYNGALLDEELSRFEPWFVRGLLDAELSSVTGQAWAVVSAQLVKSALEQPVVFVHRDFHSRNIMRAPDGSLALIDFQDAVRGPVSYDAISLLRDCYLRRGPAEVRRLAAAVRPAGVPEEQWLRWLDWMGLQRHFKVLGTFARLYLRDGRSRYLSDIPLVWRYTMEVLDAYSESPGFAELAAGLRRELEPRLHTQPWWSACA